MDQLLNINLFGRTYTFKTDDMGPRAEAVAASLTNEVNRLAESQSGQFLEMPKLTLLLLAALNFANESYELKSDKVNLERQLTRKTTRLIQTLDDALAGLANPTFSGHRKGTVPYAAS